MTRDEAEVAFESISHPASLSTASWIDRFVALGILKLDEPKKTAKQVLTNLRIAVNEFRACNFDAVIHPAGVTAIFEALESNGFEIVKKDRFNNEVNFKTYQP